MSDLGMVVALSSELQSALDAPSLMVAVGDAVRRATRYRTSWIVAAEEAPDGRWVRMLSVAGDPKELIWERAPRFPVGSDPFLLEILAGNHPVIVPDMSTDPRTDKEIVARTDHRTSICIPMRWNGTTQGALCVGTFGAEGVLPPTDGEVERLTWIASIVAAALDRVRLHEEKSAAEAQARALAQKAHDLEEQVRHLQRMEALGHLASGIAHDINNLLTAVAGHAELCSLGDTVEPETLESMSMILQATRRGAQLTHNLLSFSRKRVLTRRHAELNALADRTIRMIRPAIRSEISIQFIPSPTPVPVVVDETEVEHAMLNLLTNARDAIAGPGEITVAVSVESADESLTSESDGSLIGDCAVLRVSDTGSGMDEAIRSRIFEPFFSTKAAGHGTGLGLATVRTILSDLGGVARIESAKGRGSTFLLHFPLGGPSPTEVPSEVSLAEFSVNGRTVLVADDDDLVRPLLARVLRARGFRVLEAGDGLSAIEQFRAESGRIALVLTDLMMPRRTGLELIDAVLAFQQGTAIVAMSGYTSDQDGAARLSRLGIPVLVKPTTPSAVLKAIWHALGDESPKAAHRSRGTQ